MIAGSTVVEHIVAAAATVLVPGTVTAAAPTVTGQARYSYKCTPCCAAVN